MEFLYNAWYVAAFGDELGETILPRRILDIPIVLYRTSKGTPAALYGLCPHRYAPLHKGKLHGDSLECGYHGLRFEISGVCSLNPQSQKIPAAARLRSFPIVERDLMIWIWMGDPSLADPSQIIDCSYLVDTTRRRTVKGYTHVKANYGLVIDNLMDLTHTEFVHGDLFGTNAIATANFQVHEQGRTIHSNRWYEEGPSLPLLDRFVPAHGKPVEHWINMRWDPAANLVLDLGQTLSGKKREEGWTAISPNLLTPETAHTTHYFYSYARNMYLESVEIDHILQSGLSRAFDAQDAPMLEAIETEVGDYDSLGHVPVLLPGDAGAMMVRRSLGKLMAQERAAQPARGGEIAKLSAAKQRASIEA